MGGNIKRSNEIITVSRNIFVQKVGAFEQDLINCTYSKDQINNNLHFHKDCFNKLSGKSFFDRFTYKLFNELDRRIK